MNQSQEKRNSRTLIVSLVISIFALVGIVAVGTYSFFTATVNTTGDAGKNQSSINTANLKGTIKDGSMTGDNLIPGESITKTFSVENTGDIDINFKLVWKSVTNEFVNKNDLQVTLKEGTTEIIKASDKVILPNTQTTASDLKTGLVIRSGETKNYTLTITYLNTTSDQSADMGKSLQAVIGIDA